MQCVDSFGFVQKRHMAPARHLGKDHVGATTAHFGGGFGGQQIRIRTPDQGDGQTRQRIEQGAVTQASDLVITLTAAERRDLLSYIVKPCNFLKHADRDPLATLDDGDIDPNGAIAHALSAFTMICPGKALPDEIKPYLERHLLL